MGDGIAMVVMGGCYFKMDGKKISCFDGAASLGFCCVHEFGYICIVGIILMMVLLRDFVLFGMGQGRQEKALGVSQIALCCEKCSLCFVVGGVVLGRIHLLRGILWTLMVGLYGCGYVLWVLK